MAGAVVRQRHPACTPVRATTALVAPVRSTSVPSLTIGRPRRLSTGNALPHAMALTDVDLPAGGKGEGHRHRHR